jgi:hypothetical protein
LNKNISKHEDHIAALMAELVELRRKFDEKIKFSEDQFRELQMSFEKVGFQTMSMRKNCF